MFKSIILTISVLSLFSSHAFAELPGQDCTQSPLTALLDGCSINDGINTSSYIKLYPAVDDNITNSSSDLDIQNSMSKIVIFVDGFGQDQFNIPNDLDTLRSTENASILSVINSTSAKTESVESNALSLQAVISFINENRNSYKEIAIVGFSIGGVTSRYALADLESVSNPNNHNVGVYISYDAPHRGAHISQGIQSVLPTAYGYVAIAQDAVDFLSSLPFGLGSSLINYLNITSNTFENFIDNVNTLFFLATGLNLDSTLGKQLIIDNPADSSIQENFITSISGFYPNESINIAISNGNSQGISQVLPSNLESNGALFSFDAYKGATNNHIWLAFDMYPTATAGDISMQTTLGVKQSGCYTFFWYQRCISNEKSILNTVSVPENTEQQDFSAGSYVLQSNVLSIVAEDINGFTQKNYFTPLGDDRYNFIPTYSAFDIISVSPNDVLDLSDSPFDYVYALGDNESLIENQNFEYGLITLPDDVVAMIVKLFGPTLSPEAMAALLIEDEAQVDRVNQFLCDAIDNANKGKLASANQDLDVKARDKVNSLLSPHNIITQEQADELNTWIDELLILLNEEPDAFYEVEEYFPISC